MSAAALDAVGLSLVLRSTGEPLVTNVSLDVQPGEMVGLVGESGSGKTLTGLVIAGLLPEAITCIGGDVVVGGAAVAVGRDRRRARPGVAMIFQNPATSLNPSMTIGRQIAEAFRLHNHGASRTSAREKAVQLLDQVRIDEPHRRARSYPHELSGGMKQRVMIAIALACGASVIVADEPTTALDVSVERSVMDLLDQLRRETGTAVLLISHDIALVGERCERLFVMYAGELVETGPTRDLLRSPAHPYVRALLSCTPHGVAGPGGLVTLPGGVPRPGEIEAGCRFAPRCDQREHGCSSTTQTLLPLRLAHAVRCQVAGAREPADGVLGEVGNGATP